MSENTTLREVKASTISVLGTENPEITTLIYVIFVLISLSKGFSSLMAL